MIPGRIVFVFIDKNTNTFIPSPCTSHGDILIILSSKAFIVLLALIQFDDLEVLWFKPAFAQLIPLTLCVCAAPPTPLSSG